MSLDPSIEADPTAEAGGEQVTQEQPAERTYRQSEFDGHMANARRSWQAQAERERQAAVTQAQQEWQRANAPKPNPSDPWAEIIDPSISAKFQDALKAAIEERTAPFRQQLDSYKKQQEDLAFRNDEAGIAAKYKDYTPNRAAILNLAVQAGITNLNAAYHAWRSETQWQDPEVVGKKYLAEYQKRKATQASETPLAEGRGGGSPSTKTNFRGKDGKLDKDAMDAHALEIISASRE